MGGTQQFASFELAEMLFGIEVERVQEVTSGIEITTVPLTPPAVRGVLNLRGRIVTAIDLRRCLQLAERPDDQHPVNVILRTEDGFASLLVDHMGDVLTVDDGALRGASGDIARTFAGSDSRRLQTRRSIAAGAGCGRGLGDRWRFGMWNTLKKSCVWVSLLAVVQGPDGPGS